MDGGNALTRKLRLGLTTDRDVACVVVVRPTFDDIATAAIGNLKLKTRDLTRVRLWLRTSVGGFAVGAALPRGDCSAMLCDDAVVRVRLDDGRATELSADHALDLREMPPLPAWDASAAGGAAGCARLEAALGLRWEEAGDADGGETPATRAVAADAAEAAPAAARSLAAEAGGAAAPAAVAHARRRVRLWCDLDGTLCDFEKGAIPLVLQLAQQEGEAVPSAAELAARGLNGVRPALLWRAIGRHRAFFESLEWAAGARELWAFLKDAADAPGAAVESLAILTGVPAGKAGATAAGGKRAWCRRELGAAVPVVTCASALKFELADEARARRAAGGAALGGAGACVAVLIDDRASLRAAWEAAGGVFVQHRASDAGARESIAQLRRILRAAGAAGDDEGADDDDDEARTRGADDSAQAAGAQAGARAQQPCAAQFCAVFLDATSRRALLAAHPPAHACVFAEHCTLVLAPSAAWVERHALPRLGQPCTLEVEPGAARGAPVAARTDKRGQAVRVRVVEPWARALLAADALAHVTVSCAAGVQPAYSRALLQAAAEAAAAAAVAAAADAPGGDDDDAAAAAAEPPLRLTGVLGLAVAPAAPTPRPTAAAPADPSLTLDQLEPRVRDAVVTFVGDGAPGSRRRFKPAQLPDARARGAVHAYAEAHGVQSESEGPKGSRRLTLSVPRRARAALAPAASSQGGAGGAGAGAACEGAHASRDDADEAAARRRAARRIVVAEGEARILLGLGGPPSAPRLGSRASDSPAADVAASPVGGASEPATALAADLETASGGRLRALRAALARAHAARAHAALARLLDGLEVGRGAAAAGDAAVAVAPPAWGVPSPSHPEGAGDESTAADDDDDASDGDDDDAADDDDDGGGDDGSDDDSSAPSDAPDSGDEDARPPRAAAPRFASPLVVILRGLPGSGKSTLAAALARAWELGAPPSAAPAACVVCSADAFVAREAAAQSSRVERRAMRREGGGAQAAAAYLRAFDAGLVQLAHADCRARFDAALVARAPLVVVDNTHSRCAEFAYYARHATRGGCGLLVVEIACGSEAAACALGSRSLHAVPTRALTAMFRRWEPTADAIVLQ